MVINQLVVQPETKPTVVDTTLQANNNNNVKDLKDYEIAILITNSSSKIYKPKDYKKVVNNSIHKRK